MPTLYLIDGNSYIYRAFYAIRNLSNSSGFPTNAIYGFTNMLLKIIREKNPDYFAVVFDSPAPTERHKTYEAYKAHRPKMPDELVVQLQPLKEIVNAFRIPNIEIEGCEADDVLGTLAKKAEAEGLDVFIVTADKDINQVLSPKIKTYDTMKEKITEEKDIIERFGVEPSRFPEIIALMGDVSDNIPGVKGIGEKTAVDLLKEFGNVDNIIQNHSRIKKPKLKEAIAQNIDNIKLSLKLATIDTNVPLEISIEDLKPGEPEWQKLLEFFSKFEFKSLLKLVPGQSIDTVSSDTEYITILDESALESAIAGIKNPPSPPFDKGGMGGFSGEIAIDTETTSKSPMSAELVGISFCSETEKAYYIPLAHSYLGAPKQLSKKYALGKLKAILENPEIKKTGHNIKYDFIVLKNEGIDLKGIAFDTMIASYLLNPNKANHGLEDVSTTYLSIKKLTFNDVTDKGKKNFQDVPVEDAAKYSGEDSAVTCRLKNIFAPEIAKQGLTDLFYNIEMPLVQVLADMETAGIKIDLPLMEGFSKELEVQLAVIEKRIHFLAGEEFNINSPKQLQQILFEKLKLRTIKKTKTGYSTDVDVLEQLAPEHDLPKEILENRTLSKLKSTYVDALPRLVNPRTHRLHTSFNQTITATGRLSSSDPNMQNIPIRGEWGKRIRKAFIAENRCLLLSSDYSQIELRVLAHLSKDDGFMEIFKNDGDIHTRTACELFGAAPDSVTSEMRRMAKTVNFGIIYGISPYGLSRQLGIHPEEAKTYIDTYFMRHSGVKNYIETKIREAAETGYVSTIFGRKRAIPELKSTNKNIRQLGERLAMNTPIQGSAADIIKIAMINIRKSLNKEKLKTKMLLQVHDELLFEMPDEEKDKALMLVKKEMENAVKLDVPLKVDIGIGKNWAEAH